MPSIDLAFRLTGSAVPVDHGYALYAALSRILPEIHAAKDVAVQPIRGVYRGNGTLHLADFSRLILRLPDEQIQTYLKLAGKRLAVDDRPLNVGVPEVRMLRPVVRLRARLVTIKGFLQEDEFLAAAKRQMEQIGINGQAHLGTRRTFRVRDKQVVGFEMGVTQLTAEESLTLPGAGPWRTTENGVWGVRAVGRLTDGGNYPGKKSHSG